MDSNGKKLMHKEKNPALPFTPQKDPFWTMATDAYRCITLYFKCIYADENKEKLFSLAEILGQSVLVLYLTLGRCIGLSRQ
jgi:hypothetical protein